MDGLSLLGGQPGQQPGQQHSREEWEAAAAGVLRRMGRMTAADPDALVWQKLTRTTLDGIEIPPLGVPEALADVTVPGPPGTAPYTRGSALSSAEAGWDVRAHLADPDAASAASDALVDLENG